MNLFLDLDGTLVDSAPAIIHSLASALQVHAIDPVRKLGSELIGPPLMQTLKNITGINDDMLLEQVAETFRCTYDEYGYKMTKPYPGLLDTLEAMSGDGHILFIITNKRLHPTRLIINHLGLADLFSDVITLDITTPPHPNKASALAWALRLHRIKSTGSVMVGDTQDDIIAAASNNMPMVVADYGYGNAVMQHEMPTSARIADIGELPDIITSLDHSYAHKSNKHRTGSICEE
jgi:phosphoglycolate phosphatase